MQSLLEAAEKVQPGQSLNCLRPMYHRLVTAVCHKRYCPHHLEEALMVLRSAAFKNTDLQHINRGTMRNIAFLAVLVMELLSERARTRAALLVEEWVSRMWAAVQLAVFITPDMKPLLRQTPATIRWLKQMFLNEDQCPNPRLRLQMIRYMPLWPDNEVRGFFITALPLELAKLTAHLSLGDLLPVTRPSLSASIVWLLKTCSYHGCLNILSTLCLLQVSQLRLSHETNFFCRLVRLQGEKAKSLRYMCLNGTRNRLVVLEEFAHLLETLKVLMTHPSCMGVFHVPGLTQVGSKALAVATVNLYRCSFMLGPTEEKFKRLILTLEVTYMKIRLGCKPVLTDMARRHKALLSRIACISREVEVPLPGLPEPLLDERELFHCPDRFRDAITGEIMQNPVRVLSSCFGSRMSVDLSTLVGLAVAPRPPHTMLSPIPVIVLRDLLADITAWKAFNYALYGVEGAPLTFHHFLRPSEAGVQDYFLVDRL